MAILKGDAARQWLAQNPDKGYTDLRTGVSYGGQVPQQTGGGGGFFGNLLTSISKPFRSAVGTAGEFLGTVGDIGRVFKGDWGNVGKGAARELGDLALTEDEIEDLRANPELFGLKSAAGVLSYATPVGATKGLTGAKAIGSAGLKGALPGAMSGFSLSDPGEEFKNALTGGALGFGVGAAAQGVGEASRAIRAKQVGAGKIVDTMNVDEIAALPNRTRSGLSKQAKSAGFWDPTLSESKNIQNYLTNRGFAGSTPAETLENLTQELFSKQVC